MSMRTRRSGLMALAAIVTAAAVGVSGCSTSKASGAGGSKKVAIVAYSVPKPAYDALETAFEATPAGAGVTFSASYGASGTQSKAVANGQPADFVNFSTGSDLTKLVPTFVAPD